MSLCLQIKIKIKGVKKRMGNNSSLTMDIFEKIKSIHLELENGEKKCIDFEEIKKQMEKYPMVKTMLFSILNGLK